MSNVNIKRAVENIKSGTTVYTAIAEVIVNAIQAIEETNEQNGEINIFLIREHQQDMENGIPSVESFEVMDNGIGFTEENRKSFDTLYSDQKAKEGGKGFGRFICLKYFENLTIDSIFKNEYVFMQRTFSMGKNNDIIENEKLKETTVNKCNTTVRLQRVKSKFPDKKLLTIAKSLVEKLLPYFICETYKCPKIIVTDKYDNESLVLNDFVNNKISDGVREIPVENNSFYLNSYDNEILFTTRVFKFYSPKNQKSKISLVAHNREVTDTSIHNYIPEFIEEFYDKNQDGIVDKNYIVKAYVFSEYLDKNVSLERGGFEFQKESDLRLGISQNDVEIEASKVAKIAIGEDISKRQEKKKERVKSYVDEQAPWHKALIDEIDLTKMPYKPSNEDIETILQFEKYKREVTAKKEVGQLLADSNIENLKENVTEVVRKISQSSKNDLVHYIALRKNILDIFKKSLELDTDGKYSSEGAVHDIIFQRKGDSDKTSFEDHNLWIIDERLNFTKYVSSDLPLNGGNSERPDLMVYNKRVLFRGDNEASNPITIFEFKKPQRDDFVNPSSKEDPVQQIIRYVNNIREGEFKTPEGREILVAENTAFYGYVVCELTKKVKKWLETEKDFKPMPDQLGWFQWYKNINLYIEVISWDKVLKDAEMRNKIFFHKLGI